MMNAKLRVVSFDAGGTLIKLRRPPGEIYAEKALEHRWKVGGDVVEEAFREVWKSRPARPPGDGPREEDDRSWWAGIARETLNRCSVPEAFPFDAWFEEIYGFYATAEAWAAYEDAHDCLQALGEEFELVVLSNFDSRIFPLFDQLGLAPHFVGLYPSSRIGAEKPSPEAFLRMAARCQAEPDEILHVGDEVVADWDGARAAGLGVFELQRPERGLNQLTRALLGE